MNAAVIDVLQRAGSQDPNVLKPAEGMLREWETQSGFYTALCNVFSNHSLPVNVRWMALLYFKNGVERYWRKNAPNGIAEEEKEFLRRSLIASFDEPVNQLATHLAVVIGKIARLDCPREWNTLIPTLIEVIGGQNSIAKHRGLLTLHQVVKTLASKRLMADLKLFEQLTTNIFNFILNLWNTYTESFLILASNPAAPENQIQEALEMALLSLRILRKLTVNGSFNSISKSEDAMLFLKVIFPRAKACLECRKTLMFRGIQVESLEKFIVHLTKVLNESLNNHPKCYVEFIPPSLEFTVFYCFTEEGKALTFEKFVIQSLNLMKMILIHSDYRRLSATKSPKDCVAQRAHELKQEFFTPEILKEICSKLVTHYFLLTQEDLQMWDTDPENFTVEDARELWKYNLRTCTQSLFLSIFPQSSDVMSGVLMELMRRYHQPVDPNDCQAILMKDAIYLAVGLVAFDLYDEVDFDQWFSTTLRQELEVKSNNYRIIKRRVCWVIGKWARVKLSEKLIPELYKMMIKALSSEEDLVVRLEASNTLKQALDDFQFHIDEFMPFLETTFLLLFNLLREVTECDTKMQVLYVLSFVIERVGNDIQPYIGPLTTYLPQLWEISETHNMMRCAIISILVHYVKALRSECIIVEPMIVSMVSLSCDLNQDAHVYLMEDGLELWLALLENISTPTPGIMELFKNMPALLDSGLDQVTFKPAINIIQAYVLLSPRDFAGELGRRVIEGIRSIMSDLHSQDSLPVMELLETILRVAPEQGAQLIKPILTKIFKLVYLGEEYQLIMVMSMGLIITSRVLLNTRDVFAQVISELVKEIGGEENEGTVMTRIIDVWLVHMSYVTQSEGMKILALALCSLLNANSPPVVFQNFSTIISSIVEVLNDIMRVDDRECYIDSLLLVNNVADEHATSAEENGQHKTEHQLRLKRLDFDDPVRTVCLKEFLQNQLNTLRRIMNTNQFDQMIATLRPEIDQQLREYITL
ncbi:importin-11 [Microplitis demolitor]|uniref:importin-11 n=1 Tax=Microplitis demolitor TaxID=69319 RepID=UPI0004CCBB83|nr:importin-11 [Microplitis demolitor]